MASNADADLDDIEDGDLKRKKWSGKKIVMIAVPVLVLLIGGGVAATMLMGGGEHKSEEQAEEEDPEAAKIVYVDLPDLLVNLKSPDRKSSFLKLSISLEVKGQKQADEIKEKMPRVIDGFQVYLRELRIDDLSGSAGMFRLKEELLRRVNTSLAPLKVNDVLFKEMLVQ
ncbi:flagellar basal body-associated FliL family protein [Parapedomonas caeni]